MNKKQMWALVLIGLTVVVLIFTRGNTTVELLVTDISTKKSLAFLGFTAVGVAIGTLLK